MKKAAKPPLKRGANSKRGASGKKFHVHFGVRPHGDDFEPDLYGAKIKAGPGQIALHKRLGLVRRIALQGLSDDVIAQIGGVSKETLDYWKALHPELEDAIEQGRTAADADVIESLYNLAVGYDRNVEEVHGKDADIVRYEKHFPADIGAIKFWLSNRKRGWGEKSQVEATGKNGKPLMPKESKADIVAAILRAVRPKPDKDPDTVGKSRDTKKK